jgi:hypothetical protein
MLNSPKCQMVMETQRQNNWMKTEKFHITREAIGHLVQQINPLLGNAHNTQPTILEQCFLSVRAVCAQLITLHNNTGAVFFVWSVQGLYNGDLL